ncbi:MAG: hypothetical protein GY786_25315, partial [Proteobacteria bacterium]|nr:hypothetical protein [Pseudomonadota bacterium]
MQKIIKLVMIILLSASAIVTAYHDQSSSTTVNGNGVSTQEKQSAPGDNMTPNMQSREHKAGKLKMNVTNMGHLGNPLDMIDPCTGKRSIGAKFNGDNYLFDANFWFGGYLDSLQTEQGTVMAGPFVSTGNEGWTGHGGSDDMPRELHPVKFDQDNSGSTKGAINESSNIRGKLNCLMEDVYDPAATAE